MVLSNFRIRSSLGFGLYLILVCLTLLLHRATTMPSPVLVTNDGVLRYVGEVGQKAIYRGDHLSKFTWNDGKNYCHSQGMRLLSIETEEENNLIKSITENRSYYWTTAHKEFVWDTRNGLTVINTGFSGQNWPNLQLNSCITVSTTTALRTQYFDVDNCLNENPIICEKILNS